jgi:hypothetical protein
LAIEYRTLWETPCAQREEFALEQGQAALYRTYRSIGLGSQQPSGTPVVGCPEGAFDAFLVIATFDSAVVMIFGDGVYNSPEGMEALARAGARGPDANTAVATVRGWPTRQLAVHRSRRHL